MKKNYSQPLSEVVNVTGNLLQTAGDEFLSTQYSDDPAEEPAQGNVVFIDEDEEYVGRKRRRKLLDDSF